MYTESNSSQWSLKVLIGTSTGYITNDIISLASLFVKAALSVSRLFFFFLTVTHDAIDLAIFISG